MTRVAISPPREARHETDVVEESRFSVFMVRSLTFLRWTGVYHLRHKDGRTSLDPYLLAYNIALNLLFLPANLLTVFSWDLSVINSLIRSVTVVTFVLSLMLFSIRLTSGYKRMGNIFQMLAGVEKSLSNMGTYFSYGTPPLFYTLVTVLFWACSLIIKLYSSAKMFHYQEFVTYYMELLHTINLYGFATLLYAVEVQLTNTADQLLWIRDNPTQKMLKVKTCETLVEVHEDLCSICSDIGKLYSLQMLFTETAGFISFVANAYFCFTGRDSLMTMSIHFFEAFIGLLHGFMMCSASVNVSRKAKEFNTLLYQFMIDDQTDELSENKKLRLHISMKREVVFSACGFFNLDYALVHSMVAAATTYLVILIQFGQPVDSNVPSSTPEYQPTTIAALSSQLTTES